MKDFLKTILSFMAIAMLAIACSNEEPAPQPEPTPEPPAPLTESHALIIFMQGNNGLAEFMDNNLQRILAAYYNVPAERGRVILFYDRGNYTRLTELYLDDGMVKQRLIKEYETSVSTVDKAFVEDVFRLIRSEVEADSYGLILSSHGGGWVPADLYDVYLLGEDSRSGEPQPQPLFYGQDDLDCMEIPDLVEAIDDTHFNYIIFDACFMGNVEALYDLRNAADYIIASPAEILGAGFPYEIIVPMLFERTDHRLEDICKEYMKLYADSSGTIALVDCSKLDALAAAMGKVLATADMSRVDVDTIQAYDNFEYHLYFDLDNYVEQIATQSSLEEFRKAMAEAVIFNDYTSILYTSTGDDTPIKLNRSSGLTTYVVQDECPETGKAWSQSAWANAIGAAL